MADASCGPSNAFKGLARHIEQDRSHHQDRVVSSSQQPTQKTFRSTPKNSGLEDGFRAFQQTSAPLPEEPAANWPLLSPHLGNLPSRPAQTSTLFPPRLVPAFAQKPGNSWVDDFQRMTFPNTHARPLHDQPAQSPGNSWVNDFQRMTFANTHARPLHDQPAQSPVVGQPGVVHPMDFPRFPAFQPYQPPTSMNSTQHEFNSFPAGNVMHTSQFMSSTSVAFNAQAEADLDLEQEFADAMDEWMLQNGPEVDDLTTSLNDTSLDATSAEPTADEATKEDLEPTEEQQTELAHAAQQLVDLLAENDTEKFKNSEFLALMRRIASRQITVQGNDFVETSQSLPGTDTTSTASATPSAISEKPGSSYKNQNDPAD
ncbi:hypothetical protein F4803DRAFT_444720 [Xylaria telfairii]|nr:hypothetical protein F4803DRAFT_444720 [Xylaria telfairii]